MLPWQQSLKKVKKGHGLSLISGVQRDVKGPGQVPFVGVKVY